jgi:hypothetical protein
MSRTAQDENADRQDEPNELNEPVLIYDARCGLCSRLAHKLRRSDSTEVEIVALSSPKASRILDEFYPDGWSHDFYLVNDGACRKGARAIPAIAKIAGIRNSSGLIREYVSHKYYGEECDGCDHDHDHTHDDQQSTPDNRSIGGKMSRRAFGGMLSASAAAVSLSPLAELASATDTQQHPAPPDNLQVHVAMVSPDGQGGFEAEIQNRRDLARSEHPLQGQTLDQDEESRHLSRDSDNKKLFAGSLNVDAPQAPRSSTTDAPLQIRKMEKSIKLRNPEPQMKQALQLQGNEQRAETTSYHGFVDHQRFGLNTHVGYGPAVSESAGPTVSTTLSGTIEHDTARPVVDFLVSTADDLHAADHLGAYVTGIQKLAEFYASQGDTEMATLYKDMAPSMQGVQEQFDATVDDQRLTPESNIVAISGLPGYKGFAEAPAAAQSDQKVGHECALTCVCTLEPVCCGCGIGCGLCLPTPCKVCGCCKGYCGCSYSCCL